MKKSLCFLLLMIFSTTTYSQSNDSIRYAYNNGTIYRLGGYFMKGNERLMFRDLEHEFDISEIARISYEKAKKYRTVGKILSYASLLTSASLYAFAANGNKNGVYITIGVQFALLSGAGFYSRQSTQHLDRAIWQRNKDYLFPGK